MVNPDPAEKPETCGVKPEADQVKVEPGTLDWGIILVTAAEHCWKEVTGLVTAGLGLTVTTTSWAIPGGQPHAVRGNSIGNSFHCSS